MFFLLRFIIRILNLFWNKNGILFQSLHISFKNESFVHIYFKDIFIINTWIHLLKKYGLHVSVYFPFLVQYYISLKSSHKVFHKSNEFKNWKMKRSIFKKRDNDDTLRKMLSQNWSKMCQYWVCHILKIASKQMYSNLKISCTHYWVYYHAQKWNIIYLFLGRHIIIFDHSYVYFWGIMHSLLRHHGYL